MPARVEHRSKGRDFKKSNDFSKSNDFKKSSEIAPGPRKQKQTIGVIAPKLTCPPRPDWHATPLADISVPDSLEPLPQPLLDTVLEFAKSLLAADTSSYGVTHLQSSSSHKFLSTIMSSGTWSDKVSALTLLVQESPLHTMKPFENLLGLAGKRNRTQALMALGALKDLLGAGVLLPADRKLRAFSKQPGLLAAFQGVNSSWTSDERLPANLERAHLIVWAYEDWLKKTYFELLKILETWCNDEVEFARTRAVTFVYELLRDKPEQEENLLRLLVNKIGDTDKKIASRASHLLLQLQTSHPSMKAVIVNAIESEVLLRPGQSAHAKYYAIITLNQTILQTAKPEVANKLLDIYFSLFVAILNKSAKMKPAANKDSAAKFTTQDEAFENASKKRKRGGPVIADADKSEQELEEKIIAQILTGINRAFPYSKQDSGTFEKHLDTMFRITHSSNFNTSIQALVLIQQISSTHHISTDRYMRTLYESLLDPRLLKSSKQTMYLNLLYKSLKDDISARRVKAFVKRLLQIISLHEPSFACAILYLVGALQSSFPSLKTMLATPEALDEDEEEVFADVPDEGDAPAALPPPAKTNPSHHSSTYDGRKRDPEHSNADRTCLWELTPWQTHYHPSASLFALRLLDSGPQPPKPDPISHSLMHFLDRFAYRNVKPKKSVDAKTRGTSLMQPALGNAGAADRLLGAGVGVTGAVGAEINTEAFWSKQVQDVAADEVFFHRYFSDLAPSRKKAKEKKKKGGAGGEDGSDVDVDPELDADEDEIWKALVGSKPDIDAGGSDVDVDEDDDEDMGDFDEAMEDEDGEGSADEGERDLEDVLGSDFGDDDDDEEAADDDEGGLLLKDVDLASDDLEEAADDDDDDDDTPFGLEEESDAIFDSDEEAPVALPTADELLALTAETKKGGKGRESKQDRKAKRRKLSSLPMFASADDYAKLLENDDDEDM